MRDLPGRSRQVRKLVEDLPHDPVSSRAATHFAALCLASNPSEIQKRARKATSASLEEAVHRWRSIWPRGDVRRRILRARWRSHEFLERQQAHGYSTAIAHFTVAMMRLAAGKRDGGA